MFRTQLSSNKIKRSSSSNNKSGFLSGVFKKLNNYYYGFFFLKKKLFLLSKQTALFFVFFSRLLTISFLYLNKSLKKNFFFEVLVDSFLSLYYPKKIFFKSTFIGFLKSKNFLFRVPKNFFILQKFFFNFLKIKKNLNL